MIFGEKLEGQEAKRIEKLAGEESCRSRKSKMKRRPLAWDEAKIELAKELGLWQKVEEQGWAGLTATESGRLGGILAKKFPGKAPKEAPKNKK